MKHKLRILSILLALAMLLSITAGAIDNSEPYREFLPEMDFFVPPQWTETEISFVSGENTIAGTITKPANTDESVPVAILLHGLNTDQNWCTDIAWFLADHGIASLRFDFNGSGKSTGRQEDMTISSQVRDVIAALDYVEALSYVDMDSIYVVGKSMGALDAMIAAQGRGDEIKAMCLWYPGFGLTAATQHGMLLGEYFNPVFLPQVVTAAGYRYGKEFIRESQVLDMQSILTGYDGPVLIIHGDQDFIAPIAFSFWAEQVIPNCQLHVMWGGYHGFFGFQEMIALNDMLNFFENAA